MHANWKDVITSFFVSKCANEAQDIPLSLPWPPSANRYWRNVGGITHVSKEARQYKKTILTLSKFWKRPCLQGRVQVHIEAYPPDRRLRDLDNVLKITLDALEDAMLFVDDAQIDKLSIVRKPAVEHGELLVFVNEYIEEV